ncbi:killer toxin resistant protein [Conoideocrella luteorostrata]|uniref:Killer toxin resistant protein n=1 Tax=Conoideocrella luteorostrata TaxID=1105319 RepID=A0AAJ0D082_9HYPO|nr:killer toxin resistant protein [Conoideocrella luteorostrata]
MYRIASGHFTTASTDSELYSRFLKVLRDDRHIISSEALSTFNLALSLRSAAPRIEAHYQHYATVVKSFVDNCDAWVLLDRKQYCTPDLDNIVRDGLFTSFVSSPPYTGYRLHVNNGFSVIKTLPFDRTLGQGREAILYADPTSVEFAKYHEPLSKAARALSLNYRVRYRRANSSINKPLPISGYGVELALKKTDYVVIDDRRTSQDAEQKSLRSKDMLYGEDDDISDLNSLSTSELASIGMKAASFIQQSDEPFDTLVKLTRDFPKYASYIALHNISELFAVEYQHNHAQVVRGGINFLWMNGVQLIDRQIDPFAIVEILRRERKLVNSIQDLGFDGGQAVALLGHEAVSSAKSEEESLRYDWTDRLENGRGIIWLNDLEKDEKYKSYPKILSSLLQRTFPGQIPPIGRNIFHLVFPADLSNVEDLSFIADVLSIMDRGIPVRFGLVPLQPTNKARIQAKVAHFLVKNHGTEALLSYVQQVAQQKGVADEALLSSVTDSHPSLADTQYGSIDEIIRSDDYNEQLQSARKWTIRLHADTIVRPLFVDGVAIPRDQSWMQTMSMTIGEDLQTIQKGVYHGVLDDDIEDVSGIFLDGAALRRNMYISLNDDKSLRMLNVAKIYDENAAFFDALPILESYQDASKENWAVVTVLANMSSSAGLDLVLSALRFKRQNPAVRIDLIDTREDFSLSSQVIAALKAKQRTLEDIESTDDLQSVINSASSYAATEKYADGVKKILSEAKLAPGSQSVIINGRIVGPIVSSLPFITDDFQDLLAFEQTRRILPIYGAIKDLGLSGTVTSPIAAAKLTSIIALSTISDMPEGIFESTPRTRSTIYDNWNTSHTAIEAGDPKTANIHIVGLLDPACEKAQRWAPILKTLSKLDGVYVKLILNPKEKIEELPVKRFFRYVFEPKPIFEDDGSLQIPQAIFTGLPSDVLMTVGMDVPPAWLVAPKSSVHDLDNIRLGALKSDVEATYQLQHILIEGHSREGTGSAPRGAQLVLATETQPLLTDTIIMANLGFFQFKANPGVYNIQLKEGRSNDIYKIESIGAQGWEPVPGDEGTEVALMDFQGATVYPRLKRRPGRDKDDVLADPELGSDANIFKRGLKLAEGIFGNAKGKSSLERQHAEINIFSVASGHLYERMLNIMMVSVMKNTKHTVKFWFIEQFLSPSFKEFIPHLAEEYGFKYEMVTYKWPHWLRQQKEKQREIWGYKILFLDVLFPLSLDKVIFVDADQIVRTDMIDLVSLDLNGAPYGFTPMCDSRTEMEGFRFWKQGYWANYLRGKPYHISALYVVDLRRFRELAAGDRLRQQYHALSADPASLSNLDQDLPNHMQFQIPIHSLPQEWLWCETWCSDDSLAKARTIDLCNNPQTKEPKLDRARRQVPEWTTYDVQIAALESRQELSGVSVREIADPAVQVNNELESRYEKDEL